MMVHSGSETCRSDCKEKEIITLCGLSNGSSVYTTTRGAWAGSKACPSDSQVMSWNYANNGWTWNCK